MENIEVGEEKGLKNFLIPFSERKNKIISVSFRALNLDMDQYKMKIDSGSSDEVIGPFISYFSDLTMVIILI